MANIDTSTIEGFDGMTADERSRHCWACKSPTLLTCLDM